MTTPTLATVGHHPLAFCEWCGQPIDHPRANCPQPECRELSRWLWRQFQPRNQSADELASFDEIARIKRLEDV